MFAVGDTVWVEDPALGWKPGEVVSVVDDVMVIDGPPVDSRIVQWTIGPQALHRVTARYSSIGGEIGLLEDLTTQMRDAVRDNRMDDAVRLVQHAERLAERIDFRVALARQAVGLA